MAEQIALIDEVEAYIRRLAAGEPADVAAGLDPLSDEAIGLELERRLAPFARFVRHTDDAKAGDFLVDRPSRWGNPHKRRERTREERRRVTLAFARDFAKKSKAQLYAEVSEIQRVLRQQRKLNCGSCPPDPCHAQVWIYWALNGRDPLGPVPDSGADGWRSGQ